MDVCMYFYVYLYLSLYLHRSCHIPYGYCRKTQRGYPFERGVGTRRGVNQWGISYVRHYSYNYIHLHIYHDEIMVREECLCQASTTTGVCRPSLRASACEVIMWGPREGWVQLILVTMVASVRGTHRGPIPLTHNYMTYNNGLQPLQ